MNEIIVAAMKAQLQNLAKAGVNSESAFVRDRIINEYNEPELAKAYWSWVCSHFESDPMRFGWNVYDLQTQLNMHSTWTMPAWGMYGT